MYYGDKESAKVKIMGELVNRGWKIYGYKPDQSDMMTDYYDPASWEGIAEKNGFVLLVDVYGNGYSGQEIKERNPEASKINHERIQKLQAKADDEAAPEAEREACRGRIAAEMAKLKDQYIVVDHYPVFAFANPKNASWHLEKDGQIIAKGNGVFACNEYNWEDETRTKEQQKQEKVIKLVDRIEKAMKDNDALETEIVKVPKKVIKPVEKEDKTIYKNDILSFSYHGHYWIVTDVYTVGEQMRVTYELLGSEKRGYQRLKGMSAKRYWQPLQRLEKEMEEGKVKVYTLQEVIEYTEKTVFKKTARKQKQNLDAITLTGEVQENTITDNDNYFGKYTFTIRESKHTKTGEVIYIVNVSERLNREEFKELNDKIKALGGYYSSFKPNNGFIFKNDPTGILKVLSGSQTVETEAAEQTVIEEIAESVIDYTASLLIEKRPETTEEKTVFAEKTAGYMKQNGYSVSKVLAFIKENRQDFSLLIEALEAIVNHKNSNGKKVQDQSDFIPKIEKQIVSNKKKLESLSGDYLTNTWKRQNEEANRENKREALRFDISLLEYLKDKATNNSMTKLEQGMVIGSTREEIRNYYTRKYKYNHTLNWPVFDAEYPDGWWNVEKVYEKLQKRLAKASIFNLSQLESALEEYDNIVQSIEKPINPITAKVKRLEMEVKLRKIDGYFPTPKTIVQRMIELADIEEGETILEPSAGNGNILDGITEHINNNGIAAEVDAIEWNSSLREILKLKQYKLVNDDFMQHSGQYNKIIMNPPFERNQDIDHVKHAYNCLKSGGRIVSIMSPHWTFASDSKSVEFREWLDSVGWWEKLPEGSFKESGTGVNTVLVVIDKSESILEKSA